MSTSLIAPPFQLFTADLCSVTASSRADFCLHESFNASCRPGSVVLMMSASYGRMRLGRCIVGDYNIGCSTNVVAYMHGQCTGLPACDVPVRNLVDTHPCQRDFMSYLEATYTCIEGTLVCTTSITGKQSVERIPPSSQTMCGYLFSSTFARWRLHIAYGRHGAYAMLMQRLANVNESN